MTKKTLTSAMSTAATVSAFKMADDNDLSFENDDSLGGNSSVAIRSSQSSTTSSLLSSKYGRTKSQRQRLRQSERGDDNDDEEKTVRFSLSPGRDSLDSALSSKASTRRRRRKKTISVRSSQSSNDEQQSLESLGSPSLSRHSSQSSRQSPPRFSQDSLSSRSSRSSSSQSSRGSHRQYFESPQEEIDVRGAGTDVLAVQDAGSYRMLYDDASYLCSTITSGSPPSALDAACDLALLLANAKTRAILLSVEEGGAALTAILDTLSAVVEPDSTSLDGILGVEHPQTGDFDLYCGAMLSPDGKLIDSDEQKSNKPLTKTGRKRALEKQQVNTAMKQSGAPRNNLLHEALAAVIHFLSWDCTTSKPLSSGNASKARQVRSAILQHPTAVQCACKLALMDPVLEEILFKTLKQKDNGSIKSGLSLSSPTKSDNDDASRASSIDTRESLLGTDFSTGRKRRRKKRRIQIGQKKLEAIAEDHEFAFADSPMKPTAAVQVDMQMSFHSDDESLTRRGDDASVSTAASEQVAEKLAQVRAAIVQPEANKDDCKAKVAQHTCGRDTDGPEQSFETNLFLCGDFVLKSVSRIIDGKQGEEVSCIETETEEGDDNVKRSSQDTVDEEEDNEEELLSKNPLLITNTLLRKGGSLSTLARAMAETLSAVIAIISAGETTCIECLSHLKQRVTVLASLIDGACCLTSENRTELCGDGSQLLSSILLFLRSFCEKEHRSPAAGNLLDDIALSTLRTLTSLTHDNVVARNLLMMSYKVNAVESSVPLPGVLILANLLWKTVTNSKQSQLHSAYDMVIFCLNTLSNAVEAKNLRRMLAEYKVPITDGAASSREELFLTWLSRWLFLETTTFRDAVMRGSFGKKNANQWGTSQEMRDLEKDDEEHLITAGNGFTFMTCLMIDTKAVYAEDHQLFSTIREVILKELRVDDRGTESGILLIKNTLKAFCNFYHYSLGDLSVAIVAPVGQLIAELERMQQGQGKREDCSLLSSN